MKSIQEAKIIKNQEIAPNIYEIVLEAEKIGLEAQIGQFVNLYVGRGEHLLPRPISICEIDRDRGRLRLIYGVVGKGTKEFAKLSAGEHIRVLGPMGNGFAVDEKAENHLVIGGGIGVPPLLELVKHLQGNITVFLGFRSNPILVEDFKKLGAAVYIATDDGSGGLRGTVGDLLARHNPTADMIYTCGPKPMLKAVAHWGEDRQIPVQVSMEERMACGIGACVGCTCKTRKETDTDWENRKVCKDGPVFWSREVIWDD